MATNVPEKLAADLQEGRERLRQRKPRVYDKLIQYLGAEQRGDPLTMSLVDFALSFSCNFRCPHCCAEAFQESPATCRQMSLDEVHRVADQVDRAGAFVMNLIGGEPLVWKGLDKVIKAIDPGRFHISMTTNGWFLTSDVARQLADCGVDKVAVSLDSGLAEEHDSFRQKAGSFSRAIEAVRNVKAAGLRPMISTVVTHENIRSDGFLRLLDLSVEIGVGLDLQCATVSGGWRGKMDVLLTAEDAAYLESLRKHYPLLRRDVWSALGSEGGCPAVTRSVYIIPNGEVLPCLFIHISLGNVLKEPLGHILQRGLGITEFREFTKLCLAGEDRGFIDKYLRQTFLADRLPLTFEQGFTPLRGTHQTEISHGGS